MALQFSDTTNKNGIVEKLEDMTSTQSATTSSYSLLKKTRDINLALVNYFKIAVKAQGRWQVDDTNHTDDFPIVFGDVVSGTREYVFLQDENANQIWGIDKVRIKAPDGVNWITLKQRDVNSKDGDDEWLNNTVTGTPAEFDLQANAVVLDVIPNYNSTDGLEIYISRTPSYFISTDTTKKPGIPDMFHEYLALRPAYFFCLAKGMKQANDYRLQLYGADMKGGMEKDIANYYRERNRDENIVLTEPENINWV